MGDPVSQVFGYILLIAAVLLAWRESRAFRHRGADAWLITRKRYRRRLLVSIVLGGVGVLIAAWGHGYVEFRHPETGLPNPTTFTVYVLALGSLSITLMVLALLDFMETARNASRHALEEFSLPAEKLSGQPPADSKKQMSPADETSPDPKA